MSTQNRVFKKLAEETKVELSAQKIELAEYDFSKYMKDYDSSFTKQRSKVRDGLNSAKSALDLHFSDVNKILNSAEKEMDEFGRKAKELGFDFRQSKNFQTFQELKKILLSRISNVRQKQKEISKIL